MTRYSPDHKAKTRAHLIETARDEFRRRGFDSASIETLMRAAGLTRGGFYAHFESKEALVEEILAIEAGLVTRLRKAAVADKPRREAQDAFDDYLDPAHRESRVQCPLVAHPMDARRGGPTRAGVYTDQVESLIDVMKVIIGDREGDKAIQLTAMAVGAAILGSVVTDSDLADRIDLAVQHELRCRLEGE